MSQKTVTILIALTTILLAAAPALASEKAVIDAWAKAWTTGTGNLDSFLTEDVTFKDPYYKKSGHQGYGELLEIAHTSFSNLAIEDDELFMNGDHGALTWRVTGTHNQTGKPVDMRGVSILRFEDGKIASEWRLYDVIELGMQLGTIDGDGDGN